MANYLITKSDQDEACELTYDELFIISEQIYNSYRKLKKWHTYLENESADLKSKHDVLKNEHSIFKIEHTSLDKEHTTLLDELMHWIRNILNY